MSQTSPIVAIPVFESAKRPGSGLQFLVNSPYDAASLVVHDENLLA